MLGSYTDPNTGALIFPPNDKEQISRLDSEVGLLANIVYQVVQAINQGELVDERLVLQLKELM